MFGSQDVLLFTDLTTVTFWLATQTHTELQATNEHGWPNEILLK